VTTFFLPWTIVMIAIITIVFLGIRKNRLKAMEPSPVEGNQPGYS